MLPPIDKRKLYEHKFDKNLSRKQTESTIAQTKTTLREEILTGSNFDGFGGSAQEPPKSANITSRQNSFYFESAKINSRQI